MTLPDNDVIAELESRRTPHGLDPARNFVRGSIKWTTTNLQSSNANFCNANSTREAVVLNFGVNKSWECGPKPELDIELSHRVLSPFAAKRLTQLLQQLMKEYEARYGALSE
jgi:Protein of unknown function (DUF3467)